MVHDIVLLPLVSHRIDEVYAIALGTRDLLSPLVRQEEDRLDAGGGLSHQRNAAARRSGRYRNVTTPNLHELLPDILIDVRPQTIEVRVTLCVPRGLACRERTPLLCELDARLVRG